MGLRSFLAARLAPLPAAPAEAKSAGGTLVFTGTVPDVEGERPYRALARAGFMHNPVVYRSIRLIAENAAAIPLLLYEGSREVETHPLLDLLRRPNGGQDQAGLVEALCGHLLLSGDAFLEIVAVEGVPRALFALRPDRMG
jgi:phage portal protein BeeE